MEKTFFQRLMAIVLFGTMLLLFSIPVWAAEEPVILYTNDVHCAIDDYSKLAAYEAQLKEAGHEVLIVDAGDAIQGEVIGSETKGSAIIDLMNLTGYDYVIPGNHEFDYGMSTFLSLAKDEDTKFEYLSANLIDLKTNNKVFNAYKIVELCGEKIAFLGITTPESFAKTNPTHFQDENGNTIYSFSQGIISNEDTHDEAFYAVVQSAVDQARAEGASRVIVLGHMGIADTTVGWRSIDVIKNTTGIDVFLDAHSEEVIPGTIYKNKNNEDVLLSSTGSKFAYFGKLTLSADSVETTELIDPDNVDVNSSGTVNAAYTTVQVAIDKYNSEIEYLYDKIGTSEVKLVSNDDNGNRIVRAQETNMANFVTDAYRYVSGADVAIANSGGIRANIQEGDVSRKSFMDVNPFNNKMVVVKATGQEILDALEFGAQEYPKLYAGFLQTSGLTYEIHSYRENPVIMDGTNFVKVDETKERRVANVKVNGAALDLEKEYTVVGSSFLLEDGGDGFIMFKDNEVVKKAGLPTDSEMLIQYFTEELGSVIKESQYGNVNGSGRIKGYAKYPLTVTGIQVHELNANDVLGDGTVSYDAATNTLTLNNADLYIENLTNAAEYGIRAEGDLNIVLKGSNKIKSTDYYGIAIVAASNGSAPNVTVSGDGSLVSEGTDAGMWIRGNLTICDSAKVTSQCGDITAGTTYGIRVDTDLLVCDDAELNVKSGAAPDYSYGVYVGDDFTVSGNAKVTTEAGNGIGRSCGAYAISNIYVKENGQLITKGIDNSESGDFASESYGIRTTQMYVSGGMVEATGQGASGISAGIFTQEMEITGGKVNVNSIDAKSGQSVGIQATKKLYVSGGTLTAKSGDTTADSWAIDASGELKVTGGTIVAETGTGDRTYGIVADTAEITGGTVKVKAKAANSQSRGLQAMNDLTISGGHVEASAGDANSRSYGIQAGATITMSGGTVIASSGAASESTGIRANADVVIKSLSVKVKSQGYGIRSVSGTLEIGSADADAPDTKIEIVAVGEALSAGKEVLVYNKGHYVYFKGLSQNIKIFVPAGKSIHEVAPDLEKMLDLTKEGYEFKGFYTDEACSEGKEYSFDTIVDADITIYAKWVEKVVVPDENPDNTTKPETKPESKPDNSGVADTGDSSIVMLWLTLAVASMGAVLNMRRKCND